MLGYVWLGLWEEAAPVSAASCKSKGPLHSGGVSSHRGPKYEDPELRLGSTVDLDLYVCAQGSYLPQCL